MHFFFCTNCGSQLVDIESQCCQKCKKKFRTPTLKSVLSRATDLSNSSPIITFKRDPLKWVLISIVAVIFIFVINAIYDKLGGKMGGLVTVVMGLWIIGAIMCMLRSIYYFLVRKVVIVNEKTVSLQLYGKTIDEKVFETIDCVDVTYKHIGDGIFDGFMSLIWPNDGYWLRLSSHNIRLSEYNNGEIIPFVLEKRISENIQANMQNSSLKESSHT